MINNKNVWTLTVLMYSFNNVSTLNKPTNLFKVLQTSQNHFVPFIKHISRHQFNRHRDNRFPVDHLCIGTKERQNTRRLNRPRNSFKTDQQMPMNRIIGVAFSQRGQIWPDPTQKTLLVIMPGGGRNKAGLSGPSFHPPRLNVLAVVASALSRRIIPRRRFNRGNSHPRID